MPSTSVLKAVLALLEALDEIDVDLYQGVDRVAQPVGQQQVRFFKSRQAVVQSYLSSVDGLRRRMHGAVGLVSSQLLFLHDGADMGCSCEMLSRSRTKKSFVKSTTMLWSCSAKV
jgi:hypothetical protein